jgi:CRISPR-associated protein Cst2
MSFITGLILIDAPASALNNLGSIPGARTDNTVGVKLIRAKDGQYPYVSAQAFRYWLRTTLENSDLGWKPSPIYREEKVAYVDANPIEYWDDDLFGYMRAPSKKSSAKEKRDADPTRGEETTTTDAVTRVSPFRVSTLVSLAPVTPTDDFGVMSRQEGNPVPHEHQFYRATLRGLISLDLHASGTFSYKNKSGFRNLDDVRIEIAKKVEGIQHLEKNKSYRLPYAKRIERISALFEGLSCMEGGAKQAIHYTDVTPTLVILAVTKGGNNIFGHVIGANAKGLPEIKLDALQEALEVFADEILSPVYVGWVQGYLDDERARLVNSMQTDAGKLKNLKISHPRQAYQALISDLQKDEHLGWLD